jgi:hypothetical protein
MMQAAEDDDAVTWRLNLVAEELEAMAEAERRDLALD